MNTEKMTPQQADEALRSRPGIQLVDSWESNREIWKLEGSVLYRRPFNDAHDDWEQHHSDSLEETFGTLNIFFDFYGVRAPEPVKAIPPFPRLEVRFVRGEWQWEDYDVKGELAERLWEMVRQEMVPTKWKASRKNEEKSESIELPEELTHGKLLNAMHHWPWERQYEELARRLTRFFDDRYQRKAQ